MVNTFTVFHPKVGLDEGWNEQFLSASACNCIDPLGTDPSLTYFHFNYLLRLDLLFENGTHVGATIQPFGGSDIMCRA